MLLSHSTRKQNKLCKGEMVEENSLTDIVKPAHRLLLPTLHFFKNKKARLHLCPKEEIW